MKTIGLLLVISAVASGLEWTNLYTKWNTWLIDPFRLNSYFSLPRTSAEAITQKWVEVTDLNSLGLTTYCYPDDGQMCVLFDGYGYIAGFQAGILVSDTAGASAVYDPSNFDVYAEKTIFDETYYTTTVYTVNPTTLKAGGRSDWGEITGTEGVWFETTDGYMEVSRNSTNLDSLWIEQACIGAMGTHYYYDMHNTTDCANFFPWFLMLQDGELIGLGLQAFGSCTIEDRSWCEWVPSLAIKPTVPTCPDCLPEWVAEYGVISRHFYFTSEPWDNTC